VKQAIGTVGSRVRGWRCERGLNQREFAEQCGVSRYTVATIERGKAAGPDTLKAIARVMGTSVESLGCQN
jgi:transcriptional regulator with XRE-family HTH domain